MQISRFLGVNARVWDVLALFIVTSQCVVEKNCGSPLTEEEVTSSEMGFDYGYEILLKNNITDDLHVLPYVSNKVTVSSGPLFNDVASSRIVIETTHDLEHSQTVHHHLSCLGDNSTSGFDWLPMFESVICINISLWLKTSNGSVYFLQTEICDHDCNKYKKVSDGRLSFSSPGFPEAYPDDYSCTYLFYSEKELHIQFRDFILEEQYGDKCLDYVTLGTGNVTMGPFCGNLQTNLSRMSFDFTSHYFRLYFHSDYKVSKSGFEALVYQPIKDDCDKTFSDVNGTLTSPGYPAEYFPNTVCDMRIKLPPNYRIILTIKNLILGNKSFTNCTLEDDRILIQNGRSVLTYCNSEDLYTENEKIINSESSELSVTFYSNLFSEYQGFFLEYSGFKICEDQIYMTSTGSIEMLKVIGQYLNNQNCTVNITLPDQSDIVEVLFETFDFDSFDGLFHEGAVCATDFVEIDKGNDVIRLCGPWTFYNRPLLYRSTNNKITIKIVTNGDRARSGFKLSWRNIKTGMAPACDSVSLETPSSWLQIIWSPRSWPDAENFCSSHNGGHLVKVTDMETHELITHVLHNRSHCISETTSFWIGATDMRSETDFRWVDGSLVTWNNWFPGWPETMATDVQPSDDGFSDEDCVEVRDRFMVGGKGPVRMDSFFWNDRGCDVANAFICQFDKGQEIQIEDFSQGSLPSDCNQKITFYNTSQDFALISPLYPGRYANDINCTFEIRTMAFHRIIVAFSAFDLEDSKDCLFDYLLIVDNMTSQSVKRCGDWSAKLKLLQWKSQSTGVTVHFRADRSVSGRGFMATVSTVKEEELYLQQSLDTTGSHVTDISTNQNHFLWFRNVGLTCAQAIQLCHTYNASVWRDVDAKLLLVPFLSTDGKKPVWIMEQNTVKSCSYAFTLEPKYINCHGVLSNGLCLVTDVPCDLNLPVVCVIHRRKIESKKTSSHIFDMASPNRTLSFPPYDRQLYEDNTEVRLTFTSESGMRILLNIHNASVEFQQQCLYDSINIVGSTNDTIICGSHLHLVFLSRDRNLTVTFHSDESVVSTGFSLSWDFIYSNSCLQYSDDKNSMSSLNFPFAYPENISCCQQIKIPENMRLVLQLNFLFLPPKTVSKLTIISGSDVYEMGNDVTSKIPMDMRTYSFMGENLNMCLTSTEMSIGEGFNFSVMEVSLDTVHETRYEINLSERRDGVITNMNFPHVTPPNHITIASMTSSFHTNIQIIFVQISMDTDAFIEIIDNTISTNHVVLANITWSNYHSILDKAIVSKLNSVLLVYKTGKKLGNFTFKASYKSIYDPEFELKTQSCPTFPVCSQQTCRNEGRCLEIQNKRYTCVCSPKYTGLYCDKITCDRNQCAVDPVEAQQNGCLCQCSKGWQGSTCAPSEPNDLSDHRDLNFSECGQIYCSDHGTCVNDGQSVTCVCDHHFEGDNCSTLKTAETEVESHESLLREPMWIGMIVVLNLVFAFTSMHVIRRKCEKRYGCCFSKHKADEEEASATISDMYQRYRCPVEKLTNETPVSNQQQNADAGSITWSVSEESIDNKVAGAKLFRSYQKKSAERSLGTPCPPTPDSNTSSMGGLVGGTLSFAKDQEEAHERDSPEPSEAEELDGQTTDREISSPVGSNIARSKSTTDIPNMRAFGLGDKPEVDYEYGESSSPSCSYPRVIVLDPANKTSDELLSDSGISMCVRRKRLSEDYQAMNANNKRMLYAYASGRGHACAVNVNNRGVPGHGQVHSEPDFSPSSTDSQGEKRGSKSLDIDPHMYTLVRELTLRRLGHLDSFSTSSDSDFYRITNSTESAPTRRHRRGRSRKGRGADKYNGNNRSFESLKGRELAKMIMRKSKSQELKHSRMEIPDSSHSKSCSKNRKSRRCQSYPEKTFQHFLQSMTPPNELNSNHGDFVDYDVTPNKSGYPELFLEDNRHEGCSREGYSEPVFCDVTNGPRSTSPHHQLVACGTLEQDSRARGHFEQRHDSAYGSIHVSLDTIPDHNKSSYLSISRDSDVFVRFNDESENNVFENDYESKNLSQDDSHLNFASNEALSDNECEDGNNTQTSDYLDFTKHETVFDNDHNLQDVCQFNLSRHENTEEFEMTEFTV